MDPDFNYQPDLRQLVQIPENGILSRTLHNDEKVKVVLFGFAPGQELTAHTAPMPAIIHILEGEAHLTLGRETREAGPGAWAHMTPQLEHGILAKSPLVMLLTMIKA